MKSSAPPKRPTLRPDVISEELGVRTRRKAKLNEDVVSASNVGKAAAAVSTSQSQSLSVSWMDSLRSFKVRGPREASTGWSASSRRSPRTVALSMFSATCPPSVYSLTFSNMAMGCATGVRIFAASLLVMENWSLSVHD